MDDVQKALADCRAAWAAHPEATWGWCVHHGEEAEPLMKPISERIDYILCHKASKEMVCRLNNMRPVLSPLPKALVEVCDKCMKAFEPTRIAQMKYEEKWQACNDAYDKALANGLGFEAACIAHSQAYQDGNVYALHGSWQSNATRLLSLLSEYQQIYDLSAEELRALHRTDVPHHTWNGKTIFGDGETA
jgi:hypothetical protein